MSLIKLASFSDANAGGNPAGVHIADVHPATDEMQAIAKDVGYSETAFAHPTESGWRVRYFSPESEVPFCGHATIALGAALAMQQGPAVFKLQLNNSDITVEGQHDGEHYAAALQSPPTHSSPATDKLIEEALALFHIDNSEIDQRLPATLAHGGANHLVIALNSRAALTAMQYTLDAGRTFMNQHDLVTVMFVFAETDNLFHVRNAFASGGVYEDPATGAAAAAFSGYLRDIHWPHGGRIDIVQGEDMGSRSLIHAEITDEPGASIRVSGATRILETNG